ncbi:MAG TPA: alpha/beta fold hydrolase [Roseiflexaceae bacterium]|nr:alpha/beta fold hydrolase [Roseiflexaceae bacterium]
MTVITTFLRTLAFWLGMFESLAGARKWWGLSWLGRSVPSAFRWALPVLALPGMRARRGWLLVSLLLTLPVAVWIQIKASSRRNKMLNPLLRLHPGQYPMYTISRFDIPMLDGYLPALHVVPQGETQTAMCILHGSGCDKTSYIWRMIDMLMEQSIAVLLVDLDGHGENPRPQSFPEITEDVATAVGWLRERYERVGLLGISLGGCIAARAVADGVEVDRLALLEAPPLLHYTQRDVWREAAALVRPNLLDLFNDCTVEHMLGAWITTPIRARIGTHDLIAALDLLGSLSRIHVPLLLLYGGSDAIVKPRQAEQARRAAPPATTYALVRWASHLTLVLTPAALRLVGEWAAHLNQQAHAAQDVQHPQQDRSGV